MPETGPYPIPGFNDPVSSLTHFAGASFVAFLTPFLLRRARDHPRYWGYLATFAVASILLLSTSGIYHLLAVGDGRLVLQRLDHGAIFVMIAGTFTPVHGICFRGKARWVPLVLMWLAATLGLTLKTVFFTDLAEGLGLMFYIVLGWAGLFTVMTLWRRFGYGFVEPLVWGGAAYTVGGVLEFLRWPVLIPGVVGPHELFHVGVLAGLGLHWRFVFRIASGELPDRRERPKPLGGSFHE